jgi:hypothetical protein
MGIYTKNQSKNKITHVNGMWLSSLTCINKDDSETIPLTGLEAMWYNHEECIDHPEGSDYPVGINEPFRKLMLDRIRLSVLDRTGIDIAQFEQVIHASTCPARDEKGNIIKN